MSTEAPTTNIIFDGKSILRPNLNSSENLNYYYSKSIYPNTKPLLYFGIIKRAKEEDVYKTLLCLYEKEFKPIYAEILCPCPSCYDRALWNKMVYVSSQLNKFAIWNDIIKRWETSRKINNNQIISNDKLAENFTNYSFKSMEEIYSHAKINFDIYFGYCEDCPPKYFSPKGKMFSYKYSKNAKNLEDEKCSICQVKEPKLAIRAFSNITKRMEIVSSNILITNKHVFELKNTIEYSPIFDILMEIPENLFESIVECNGKTYVCEKSSFNVSAQKGFFRLTNVVSFGTYSDNISIKFKNVANQNDIITCNYTWNVTLSEFKNPKIQSS